ncbi:acetyl-CoA acetyltransferase [Paenibacillus sp. GYB003]|jgi:hypothetical protein|uniref:acetyl-CoA acetyltransferase n=1 Tax=Paenibacillus sp. GYB003 TaxID=2994392 RepID=UPI002F968265
MTNGSMQASQALYEADPAFVQALKSCRERLNDVCRQCANRPVRIQTIHGHVHEGVIAGIDDRHLYLSVKAHDARGFFNPLYQAYTYNNVILPLVLYELLVISLLYS